VATAYRIRRVLVGLAAVSITLLGSCTPSAAPASTAAPAAESALSLPGEEAWHGGVSSLLFGINQSFDWAGSNLENTTAAQQLLKQTGFTLIRTFFSEQHQGWPVHKGPTTDGDLELRFQAIENSGAQCLGVLYVLDDPQFDSSLKFLDHVLTFAESSKPGVVRCRLWEYGNEYGNMTTYLKRWNHDIPYLRARHPEARFIGPVIAGPYVDQMQKFLDGVKASGVLPDAVSYHDYPCYKSPDYLDTAADAAACDAMINPQYASTIAEFRGMISTTLGKDVPLGITEWNVSPNFVNLVDGIRPLTVSPSYLPHFVREIYAAMSSGGLRFAAEYSAMCGCGVGSAGSLDLIDANGMPQPWAVDYRSVITAAR